MNLYVNGETFSLHELCPQHKLISSLKITKGQTRFFPLLVVCSSALQTADLADKTTEKLSRHFDELKKIYAQGELLGIFKGYPELLINLFHTIM